MVQYEETSLHMLMFFVSEYTCKTVFIPIGTLAGRSNKVMKDSLRKPLDTINHLPQGIKTRKH